MKETREGVAFAADYEAVSAELGNAPLLGERWRDYRATLILPSAPGRPVRATQRPEAWFELNGLLRSAGAKLRYHAALPNFLVGSGLLFTFLGLAVALGAAGGIVAEGASQGERNAALRSLLDTASFKFVTSLVGLFLSIVYALYRNAVLRLAEVSLDRFLAALEARIPLVTPAVLQQEANEVLEKQVEQLELFNTDLALNIGTALDRAFDQRLGEHIGPLAEAIEKLSAGMSSRNEDAMQRMLDAFLERLQGGTADRMHQVVESLAGLGTRLEGLQTGLGEAAVRMAQSADAMASRMGEGAEAALRRITDQMASVVDSLRAVADQTRTAGAEAGAALGQRIEAAAAGFEAAARSVSETLASAAQGLERRMGEEAAASSARLAAQFEAMVAELRTLAESSRAAGSAAFEALAERIATAASGFEATAGRVAETLSQAADATGGALGRGAEDAVRRIADATEGMRTELQAMLTELRSAMGAAGDAVREGARQGGDSVRSSLEAAGDTLATAVAAAAGSLRDAGASAGTALREGGQSASAKLEGAAGSFGSR